MTKSESLLHRVGSNLADSIGVRPGQPTKPVYSGIPGEAPKTDFVRNRSVGDIHPSEIIPDPNQPRKHFSEEELDQLAADIQKRGQLQPIRVRWSSTHAKWLIIAGERRWRAITKAGLEKISCIFIDREMTETEIRTEQLVENLLREDLNGIDLAKSFSSLMQLNGWSATELAHSLNVSKAKVSKALALLKLPEQLQARVASGEISPSTAYELAKVKDQKAQRALADKAASGQMTQPEAAKVMRAAAGKTRTRKTTNESFRTTDNVRVTIVARRDLGDTRMVQVLLEVIESIRNRAKTTGDVLSDGRAKPRTHAA
jgi:ParB family chromosome partitioning protein